MKKLLAFLFLTAISYTAFAQGAKSANELPTITFGFKGGGNFSNQTVNGISGSYLTGFQLGGVVDFGFKNFSIEPGIFYTTKGSASPGGETAVYFGRDGAPNDTTTIRNKKTTISYIELPIDFAYKIPAGKNHIIIGAGPYMAYGVSGTYKFDVFDSMGPTTHQSESVHFGNGIDNSFKRLDYGLNFMLGYQLNNGFNLLAGYDMGLANISPVGSYSEKNQSINITLAYFFKYSK